MSFYKVLCAYIFSALAFISMSFSSTVVACDTKSCEISHQVTIERYADNRIRHAVMQRAERLAYAKNRENKDVASQLKTHRYVENETRHVIMSHAERLAYAKNRERRSLAARIHIHQTRSIHPQAVAMTGKSIIKSQTTSIPVVNETTDINHVKLDK